MPILDNFELAFKNADKNDEKLKGFELIFSQLYETLQKQGLEKIQAKDKPFDPNLHEALLQEESDKEKNMVLEELQRGYTLHGQVIRHAKVKISNKR